MLCRFSRFLAGSALVLLGLSFVPVAPAAQDKPNIIFVFADDQTPAYLSCYGGRTPTPNLDRLAKEGALFANAHSVAPLCNPTRWTVLSGQFPSRNRKMIADAKPGEPTVVLQNTQLDPDLPCVAEMLGRAGYATGFVGKWHSNFDLKELGIEALPPAPKDPDAPGADDVLKKRQELMAAAIRKAARFEHVSHVMWGNLRGEKEAPLANHNPEWLTDGAIAFIEKSVAENRPFFLHLADTVPHAPNACYALDVDPRYTPGGKQSEPSKHHPPRASLVARLKAAGLPVSGQHVGALMLDDQIAALLAALERLGQAENTLVVFAQDNGQLGKGSCYSGGTHSALVMRWPKGIKAGTVLKENVSFVDFVPTFLAAAGATPPAEYRADGLSLLPLLRGEGGLARTSIYCEAGVARSVIKGKYRYVAFRPTKSSLADMESGAVKAATDHWGNEKGGDNTWLMPYKPAFFDPDQIYDLEKDPLERNNLAKDPAHAALLAELKAELAKHLATLPTPYPMEISPFVSTPRYAELVKARRAASAKGDYWPGYPEQDWESYLNLNLKTPEEIDPAHRSAYQGKAAGN